MAHVIVYASDPAERSMLRDVLTELGGYHVTAATGEGDALAQLGAAPRPSVVVLAMDGDEGIDAPAAHLLAAVHLLAGVRTTGVTRPAHRVVGYTWRVPSDPALRDLVATEHVRWVLRPGPTAQLLDAVRAATGGIRAA